MTRSFRTQKLLPFLFLAVAALPKCSCEEGTINRAKSEMNLTFVEIDSCTMAAIPRRLPDAFGMDIGSNDVGSRGVRVFELRSKGDSNLTVSSVELVCTTCPTGEPDAEFTLEVVDGAGMAAVLPSSFAPNTDLAALTITVHYAASDMIADRVELVVKSDDPDREEVRFALVAGKGKLEACVEGNCSASAIDFGDVSRDPPMTSTKKVTLKNVGEGDLQLFDVKLDVLSQEFCAPEATTLPEGFSECQTVNKCLILGPGESYDVNVSYTPRDGGDDTGFLQVRSTDTSTNTITIPINARGAGPGLCVCVVDGAACVPAGNIDFGAVGVGAASTKTVRIVSCGTQDSNLGEAVLETDPNNSLYFTGPEFSITRPFMLGTVPSGMFSEGEITYQPAGPGVHKGGFRFALQGGNPSWIPLSGQAATCDLQVFPDMVNFGTVGSGGSTDRNVVIVNNGARDCTVSAITDPANAAFTFVAKPTLPFTVALGQSINLAVRYTAPTRAMPAPDMSSFDVTSDGSTPNHPVTLTAQGGGQAVCDVEVLPNNGSSTGMRHGTLNFGATNIGYTKVLGIRITNNGTANCSLQNATLMSTAGTQFRVAIPANRMISPGTALVVDVTFAPTQPSALPFGYTPLAHSVEVSLAGPGLMTTAYSIGLSARPTVATIDIIPDELDFGVVTWERPIAAEMNRSSCGSEARQVRVYNSGTGPLEITSIEIEAGSDPLFRITAVRNSGANVNAPYMMTVAPGAFAEVDVRFFPTRAMPAGHRGNLVVNNSATMVSTVPLRGEGTSNTRQTDNFSQLADNKIDVLWVVDDSGSMSEEQTALTQNFASFIQIADMANVDYQVGIVTTDTDSANRSGKLVGSGANKIVRRNTAPSPGQVFTQNGNVGTNGSGEEKGLSAAKLALEPPIRDVENAGFLRADARLAVVIVSDEEDYSAGTVGLYVDFFRNIKGFRNPQLVSLNAIVGDPGSGCATAEAGDRYADAANQLNGQIESICTANWAPMLSRLGLGVFTLRTAWTLSRNADPASIAVTVNGMNVPRNATNGWTYDAASNSIEFHGTAVPQPAQPIVVQYGSLCLM